MQEPLSEQYKLLYNLIGQNSVIENELERLDNEIQRSNNDRKDAVQGIREQINSLAEQITALGKSFQELATSETTKRNAIDTQIERWKGQLELTRWIVGVVGVSGIISYIATFQKLAGK
jgi:uncharacterized protein YlxW (UPF0749 family)